MASNVVPTSLTSKERMYCTINRRTFMEISEFRESISNLSIKDFVLVKGLELRFI